MAMIDSNCNMTAVTVHADLFPSPVSCCMRIHRQMCIEMRACWLTGYVLLKQSL